MIAFQGQTGGTMTHNQVVRRDYVNKYLLGKLLPLESEEFEEHYLTCGKCIEKLEKTADFVDAIRAALAKKQERRGKQRAVRKKRKPRLT